MLKRQNRLAKINKKGQSKFFASPNFNIRISGNKEKETRFGIVVSKKTSKKAVLRNKTKRIIREIIRENIKDIAKGKDIIIVSKKTLNQKLRKEAEQDLLNVFKKARIIK